MDVLSEALEITSGDRNADYGEPGENHGCTAALWNAYLARRWSTGADGVDATDVCVLNMLQKLSRFAWRRTRDSMVDVAGYARNAAVCEGWERIETADGPVEVPMPMGECNGCHAWPPCLSPSCWHCCPDCGRAWRVRGTCECQAAA